MSTEGTSERYRGLDSWPSRDILDAMAEGQMAAIAAVHAALPAIAAAAEATAARLALGGRLIYLGAGTSGRIAVQDGVELTPTFDWPTERLVFLLAGGTAALTRSIEGAEDDAGTAEAAVDDAALGATDVAVGLAASGGTPFTCAGLARARARGALTIGVANNQGARLLAVAEHPILLDTGAETIAGSTRMKAGTAQKAMLNLWSTLVMVRLGRVYDGLMVDLRATNRKLVARSEAMLVRLTGCDGAAARVALDRCGGRVKPAVLVLARGLSPDQALAALDRTGGHLRAALAAAAPGP